MHVGGAVARAREAVAEAEEGALALADQPGEGLGFDVEEGDFVVSVINPSGGEFIDDQSLGEERMASYITTFSAKDAMTPCNIMILDEPGEGLDSANASLFAERLREIAPRIGCVLVTSHRPEIISALSGERWIEVVKKNGTSRVKEHV